VTLRPPTDSFWFDGVTRIVRASSGDYVVQLAGTPSPVVFANDGRFDKPLMNTGNGPAEIGRSGPGFFGAAPNGELWVFDASKGGARHVFDRSLRFVRTDPPAEFKAAQSGFVAANGEIVFAAAIPSRQHAGFPLHVAGRSGSIIRSFGVDNPGTRPRVPPDSLFLRMLRRVEPGPDLTFWSYNPSEFLVERWSTDATRMYRVQHSFDGWYAEVTRELQGLRAPNYSVPARLNLAHI
jgi:hypothetical protein